MYYNSSAISQGRIKRPVMTLAEAGDGEALTQERVRKSATSHFFGIGSLIVTFVAVPAIISAADRDPMTQADRWIIRGGALAAAAILGPLGTMYLAGITNGRK
jgi:hypothetical protein